VTLYRVVNPATNELEREFPTATDADVESVLARSHSAFAAWRSADKAERAKLLTRVAELYEERADELGAIVTREMGKKAAEAQGETKIAAAIYRYYADQGPGLLADTPLDPAAGGRAVVRKQPVGPLLGIMPWNYPHYQVARFAAPNLMAGNTIVLKHAPQCPESAATIEQIFTDAGFPVGCYLNIYATNEQVAGMIADPRIAGISVTGSERAGAAVAEIAGRNLKKVILELGGSDPFIVLDTADLDRTVNTALAGRMSNAGQACNAAKRIMVADGLYDQFVERFTAAMGALTPGDPTDPSSDFGPLSSEAAAQGLMAQIEDAVAKGATVRTGGHRVSRPGAYVEPTVLTEVTPDMRAFHEELFGPAAVIYRIHDEQEAITLANDSAFGLGGVVYTEDTALAERVADQLDTGMVWINTVQRSAADLPFGGTKRSGIGRELGPNGIDEFVNKKLIYDPQG
jgi:succinate-semialdehyde dehydrogenase/glutarate-semialdehyde dehydrogenase